MAGKGFWKALGPDSIFKGLTLTLLAGAAWHYRGVHDVVERYAVANPDHPRFADLWWGVGYGVCFALLVEAVWRPALLPWARRLILANKWSPEVAEVRAAQMVRHVFRFVYLLVLTGAAYWYLLCQLDWLPYGMGGPLSLGDTVRRYWDNFPMSKPDPWISRYFIVNLGLQVANLIGLFLERPYPDFPESVLQHTSAVVVIGLSYVINQHMAGAVIMLCHDIADVFITGVRTIVDTSYRKSTIVLFFGLLVFWAIFRLYFYSALCIVPFFEFTVGPTRPPFEFPYSWTWFSFVILIILCLNIYWFILICKIALHVLKNGQPSDAQDAYAKPPPTATKSALKTA